MHSLTKGCEVNILLLACLLPSRYPKRIDANTLTSAALAPFRSFQLNIGGDRCKARGIPAQGTVIQFTGQVGTGDRCLRADSPFPPKCSKVSSSRFRSSKGVLTWMKKKGRTPRIKKFTSAGLGDQSPMNQFLSSLSRPASFTHSRKKHHDDFRPFVVPTVLSRSTNGLHHGLVVDLTPRMVAYFEVTILKQDSSEDQSPSKTLMAERINQGQASVQHHECVAIGLSTEAFCPDDRMPGWDDHSYGYHSDDGGVFHGENAAAHQNRHVALFGPGDTVGCGIEYSTRMIFFTKNGEFLGFEFEKVSKDILNKGLYPTVGVDTKSPLFMNLGEQPFMFDLKRALKEQSRK